jgi:hypothetical protein
MRVWACFEELASDSTILAKIIPNMPTLYLQTRYWIGCFSSICKLEFPDANSVPLLQRGLREIMLPGKVKDKVNG